MTYKELKEKAFGVNQWSPICESDIGRLLLHCARNFDKALEALKQEHEDRVLSGEFSGRVDELADLIEELETVEGL